MRARRRSGSDGDSDDGRTASSNDVADERCVVGPDSATPRALLWGDSFAAQYVGMIGVFARESGFRFRNAAVGSCPPILGDPGPFVAANRLGDCRISAERIRPLLQEFQVIIISAAWRGYQETSSAFMEEFFRTAKALAMEGRLVILVGEVPPMTGYDRRCREKALTFPGLSCPLMVTPFPQDSAGGSAQIREFVRRNPNVRYFEVTPFLCENVTCSAYDPQGNPRYYDPNHLSMPVSWDLGESILGKVGVPSPFDLIADWRHGTH